MRYTYQAAHAFGIEGEHLRDILAEEIQDELGHAREIRRILKGL